MDPNWYRLDLKGQDETLRKQAEGRLWRVSQASKGQRRSLRRDGFSQSSVHTSAWQDGKDGY